MELQEIKNAVGEWSKVRNSAHEVIRYLKQGNCFKIERANYELWKDKAPESLHAYLAIFDGDLKFVLVDSESDKNPAANTSFYVIQDYYPSLSSSAAEFVERAVDGTSISVIEGLKRVTKWMVSMETWVKVNVSAPNGIFQAFDIPFADLVSIFDAASCKEAVVMFGLQGKKADLVLWGVRADEPAASMLRTASVDSMTEMDGADGEPVENLACPVPPFGASEFGLI